jgi:CRP-like cAMP-binding protein
MPDTARQRLRAGWRRLREGASTTPAPSRRTATTTPLPDSLLAQPLFGDLSPSEAAMLGLFVQREAVEAGQTVVRQGEQGDALFLIEEGQAEVRATGQDGTVATIATLGPGHYFGEIALVTGGPRTADVVAITPLTLLRLDRVGYELLAQVAATEDLAHTAHRRAAETKARLAGAAEPHVAG